MKIRRLQTLRAAISCVIGTAVLDLFSVIAFQLELRGSSSGLLTVWIFTVVKIIVQTATIALFVRELRNKHFNMAFEPRQTLSSLLSLGAFTQLILAIVVSVLFGSLQTITSFALILCNTFLYLCTSLLLYILVEKMTDYDEEIIKSYKTQKNPEEVTRPPSSLTSASPALSYVGSVDQSSSAWPAMTYVGSVAVSETGKRDKMGNHE